MMQNRNWLFVAVLALGLTLSSCANFNTIPPDLSRVGNVPTTPPSEIDAYYASAQGLSGPQLKAALHNIIKNHTFVPYGSSGSGVWGALMDLDEDPNNTNNIIYVYSRRSEPKTRTQYNNPSDMDAWNREHTFPKSRSFNNSSWPAYTDLHHMRPEDRTVNSSRGDKDFKNGGTNSLADAPLVKTAPGTWEPPDEIKGDIARGIFYMAVRYEGTAPNEPDLEVVNRATTSGEPNIGYLNDLLAWHDLDPVDDRERLRNEKIYRNYQGNRNPFIDHPEWVRQIWTEQ